ncbi:hypothetical protein ACT4MK_17785 [Bradyrhizobium barranii]|uniref:hypothetical protein n=1 Tax=Bradyrhizobium TaxID=374 RepID=UPI003398F271
MVIAETLSGLSALKTALDMTRALKDIHDATVRNSAVMDLQEKILSAREAQTALLERISELEKQIAAFEQWDDEKENYQLTTIHRDTLAYVRKPDIGGTIPPHYICANCYEDRKKRILQRADAAHVICPDCKIRLQLDSEEAKQFRRPLKPRSDGWT